MESYVFSSLRSKTNLDLTALIFKKGTNIVIIKNVQGNSTSAWPA